MLILAGLAVAVFVLFIDGPDIVTSHEARVAQPARQMAASGWPWAAQSIAVPQVRLVPGTIRLVADTEKPNILVNPWQIPVLNGQARLQKPPLPYWCAAALFRFFGFHVWSVRLIPALLGAIATFFIYDLGRRLFGAHIGWCAALVWVSSYAIPEMYRKAMADPYLGFFTLICVWAWVGATADLNEEHFAPQSERVPRSGWFPGIWLVAFYAAFGFALLAKGPPALVTILIPLAAYHFCFRRPIPANPGHIVGILILILLVLPWPLYVIRHIPHVWDLWRYESFGELSDNVENARPWWFYGQQIFYLSLPWTPMWIVGWFVPFRRDRTGNERALRIDWPLMFPLVWFGASLLFFSFLNQKKNQYLLPAMPAQVLMTALGLWSILSAARKLEFKGLAGGLLIAQTLIGVGFSVATGVMIHSVIRANNAWMAILPLVVSLLPLIAIRAKRPRRWLVLQAIAYGTAILFFFVLYIRPLENQRSARQVAAEMLALAQQPDHTILVPRLPEEVSVYLPLDLTYGPQAKVLTVVDDSRGVRDRALHRRPIPAPNPETFQRMIADGQVVSVRRVPLKSAPGDARWKVYEITVRRAGFATRNSSKRPYPTAFCAATS